MNTSKNNTKMKKAHLKKKTTAYEIRKQRKRGLVEQAKRMQQEVDALKFQVLFKHGEVDKANRRVQAENTVLNEFIQQQHLIFARTQAALAAHAQQNLGSLQPAQSVIRLGADREVRHKTLMALKERKLEYAKYYLLARSQGLNPASLYCQEERIDSRDGNYCVVRFENLAIRGATVKEVFNAVLGTILNAEIWLSEMFGSISVREDNEFETSEFAQIRLASSISSGEIVESNTVLFSKYAGGAEDGYGSHGVIAADFVDSDKLYPYHTRNRVRLDTTSMVMVQSFSEAMQQAGYPKQFGALEVKHRPDVVITRWTCLKRYASDMHTSRDPDRDMKESSVCWGDTAKRCVEQQLVHATCSSLTDN